MVEDLKVVGGEKFIEKFTTLVTGLQKGMVPTVGRTKHQPNPRTRKIVYFPDREDKVRVIAILDYFTQSVLKPLHH